jgi:hypothetical protein
MYEGDKQEHNKEVFFDKDDENEEGIDQRDNNSRSDSKIMHKVLKPTGYKMLMKALGLTNHVMEKHLDVTSIDETKMMKLVSQLRPAKKKNVVLSKGSPHQLDTKVLSKYKKTDLEDDEDNKQASPVQSPKASPTRIAKYDPNQSLNNLRDDEEMLEKMTNIERIMYQIQSQLEIADLYCGNKNEDEDEDPFMTINTETNAMTNSPKTSSLLRHKITLPIEHEAVPTPNSARIPKKKITNRNNTSSKMLALLCEKEFG